MDIALLIIAAALMIIGIIGCIVPGLPGVPISYIGLIVAQFSDYVDFGWWVFVIWGIITVVVTVMDYVIPAWGAKTFGGTKYGMWGSTIGVFVGLFAGVWGILIGPFLGAFIGELIGGKEGKEALKAGWGSFLGLLCGTLLKLVCSVWLLVDLVIAIFV